MMLFVAMAMDIVWVSLGVMLAWKMDSPSIAMNDWAWFFGDDFVFGWRVDFFFVGFVVTLGISYLCLGGDRYIYIPQMLYSPLFSAQKKVEEFSIKAEVFDLFAWNLFVLYFGGWTLQNKALFYQNRGHLGSRCKYIYIYVQFFLLHLQQANPRMVIFFGGKNILLVKRFLRPNNIVWRLWNLKLLHWIYGSGSCKYVLMFSRCEYLVLLSPFFAGGVGNFQFED